MTKAQLEEEIERLKTLINGWDVMVSSWTTIYEEIQFSNPEDKVFHANVLETMTHSAELLRMAL